MYRLLLLLLRLRNRQHPDVHIACSTGTIVVDSGVSPHAVALTEAVLHEIVVEVTGLSGCATTTTLCQFGQAPVQCSQS